jgi:hypothetical protein
LQPSPESSAAVHGRIRFIHGALADWNTAIEIGRPMLIL